MTFDWSTMNRKHSHVLAGITAVMMAVASAFAVFDSTAHAEPGEASGAGMRLVASVDTNVVVSTGDLALGVPFAHSAKVSGNFTATLDGASSLRGGLLVAGYLVGCAVDISEGIDISIAAATGANIDVTPELLGLGVGLGLDLDMPPGVAVDLALDLGGDVTFGVFGEVGGEITVSINPGSVTVVAIAEAELDDDSVFPFTFAHSNTALNVNGCLSPASAIPFLTVRADARNGIVQTTGYGPHFVF
ncbi:MspA family porin [Nocardia amikacinitolerans]|uniref:MspA family porin n=1 Tax=Nocardia amikacinitolerans TaxID=756689 RepID=UPI0020A614D0|nr:MspA family porin [Nocardia amikacinitolerans]